MKKDSTLRGGNASDRYMELHQTLQRLLPQFYARLTDEQEFRGLRLYVRDDATYMAVLKGYGSDGGPTVCFGSAFDAITCLLGLEGALAADKWMTDVPWDKRQG